MNFEYDLTDLEVIGNITDYDVKTEAIKMINEITRLRNEIKELKNLNIADVSGSNHECKFYVNAAWTELKCECGKRIKPSTKDS